MLDEKEKQKTISQLATLYRKAVDGGDPTLASFSQKALLELADAQAALTRAAVLTAFAADSNA